MPPLAVPQLGSCASSGRAWWLWAARYSQGEAQPLGPQPRPRGLKRAASKVADSTAFDHPGVDLLAASLPEAAHGFMQRALRSAPKRESDLVAEIMGSLCVTLNQLRRHAEALRMAEAACEMLGRSKRPSVSPSPSPNPNPDPHPSPSPSPSP